MNKFLSFFQSNKSLQNLVLYGIGQAFNLITPLLVIPYILSVCGEESYGKISVGMALSFFMIVFIDYGSDIIGVKEVSINRDDPDRLRKIVATTYSARFVSLLSVVAVASLLFYFVPFFSGEQTLYFFGLSILVGQYINPTWFLQGVENFKWITFLNIISKVIYVACIFVFVRHAQDYVYVNLFWGIGMIVANGIALLYALSHYSLTIVNTQKDEVFGLLRSNFSMFFSQIFVSLQMYAPVMLVSYFGSNTMAGQYKIVDQVIVIFKTYILLFFNFIFPKVCYLLQQGTRQALRFWKIYNGLNGLFIWISAVVIYCFSTPIVAYFNPTEVATISNLLKIAVLIPVVQSVNIPLKQLVLGVNKQKQYIRLTMATTVLSLLLIIVSTPVFGLQGVFAILIGIELLIGALYYLSIKKALFARSG